MSSHINNPQQSFKYHSFALTSRHTGFPINPALFFSTITPSPEQTPRRPSIAPIPIQHRIPHRTLPDRLIVHIRDLKLTAPGGFQCLDNIEHVVVIDVQPCDSVIRFRNIRLLLDASNTATDLVHFGDAETCRIGYRFQEDAGAGCEGLYGVLCVVLEDVVSEDYGYTVVVCEIFCKGEGLCDSASLVLDLVGEAGVEVCA